MKEFLTFSHNRIFQKESRNLLSFFFLRMDNRSQMD